MAHVCFYVCCSACVGVCGNVCFVTAVVEEFLAVECWSLLYVCVRDVIYVVFSICIVRRGAVGTHLMKVLYVCVVVCPFQPSSSLIQVLRF